MIYGRYNLAGLVRASYFVSGALTGAITDPAGHACGALGNSKPGRFSATSSMSLVDESEYVTLRPMKNNRISNWVTTRVVRQELKLDRKHMSQPLPAEITCNGNKNSHIQKDSGMSGRRCHLFCYLTTCVTDVEKTKTPGNHHLCVELQSIYQQTLN